MEHAGVGCGKAQKKGLMADMTKNGKTVGPEGFRSRYPRIFPPSGPVPERFTEGDRLLGASALLIAGEADEGTIRRVFGPVVDGWGDQPYDDDDDGDGDDEPWFDRMPWRDPEGPYAMADGKPALVLGMVLAGMPPTLLAVDPGAGADSRALEVPDLLPAMVGVDAGGGLFRYNDGVPAGAGAEAAATGEYLCSVREAVEGLPAGMRLWYLAGQTWQ